MSHQASTPSSYPAPRNNPLHFIVPGLLLCILIGLSWKYFQHYVDLDAISYLHITECYVKGDYTHAVNAFWSPMGYWVTALLVKATGWPLFASAIICNSIPALGIVLAGQSLFHKFRSSGTERWCFGLMSAVFWTYATYYQSFTDAWQFFFLITGLLILLNKNFIHRPVQWFLIGIVAALSYYGKAYSFYFYPLMILIVTALTLKAAGKLTLKRLTLISIVSIGVMMLAIAPWIYLIHEKYGIWTSSTAGKLNMSWWLVGTQEFREGVTVLVPPPYKGSLFYFEDPYLLQGRMAHFWDSPALFVKLLIRIGYNFVDWVNSANRISLCYFFVWTLSILLLFFRKPDLPDTTPRKILLVLFLLFPLPYWLLTFNGGRYLWFTIPLVSILALDFADVLLFPRLNRALRRVFIVVFFMSFIITPVIDMKAMLKGPDSEYAMAMELKQLGISGSFACNRSYADGAASIVRLAWFSKNAWYCHTLNQFSTEEILRDAKRYDVKYYFYFYDGAGWEYQLKDTEGHLLPDLTKGSIPGLKVFRIGNGG